jgi:hypothetical protein
MVPLVVTRVSLFFVLFCFVFFFEVHKYFQEVLQFPGSNMGAINSGFHSCITKGVCSNAPESFGHAKWIWIVPAYQLSSVIVSRGLDLNAFRSKLHTQLKYLRALLVNTYTWRCCVRLHQQGVKRKTNFFKQSRQFVANVTWSYQITQAHNAFLTSFASKEMDIGVCLSTHEDATSKKKNIYIYIYIYKEKCNINMISLLVTIKCIMG